MVPLQKYKTDASLETGPPVQENDITPLIIEENTMVAVIQKVMTRNNDGGNIASVNF